MNVEFDILQWNPVVDEGAGFKPVQAGGFVYIEVPSPNSEGLFSTTAKVRIRTVPTAPLDQSNALCAQWTAEIVQNIVHFGSRQSIYQHSKWITTLDEIPCLDHNLGNDESRDFTAANETVQVKVVDTPGFWTTGIICLDASTGMPVPNPLNFVEDDVKFITWLTVRNRTTGERRFLRWVRWRSRWKLTVNVPPNGHLPAPAPTAVWQGTPSFTIISGGVGQGSVPAVFNKRKTKEIRVPPLP